MASLPTAAQFSATLPAGFGLDGRILLTQANANALGFNVNFGADANIIFNSTFAFDFDSSNGVGAGLVDFETVALHELGHALGFISAVDDVDFLRANGLTDDILPTTLDLFRFASGTAPTTAAEFTSKPRSLVPGAEAVTSDVANAWRMSTGFFTGDGRQASPWKDDAFVAHIGVMDPTLSAGVSFGLTPADIRAFDLIGWDFVPNAPGPAPIPEPASMVLLGSGLLAVGWFRRKGRVQSTH